MTLENVRAARFDPNLFGTRAHRMLQAVNDSLWRETSPERDSFAGTVRADMRQIAGVTQTAFDHTLHAVVGTGLGPDSWQTKRGVFGPYKDGMIEGTRLFCTHALRAGATFYGIVASLVVGLPNHCKGSSQPQTTEHWVYWAKNITDGWAARTADHSAVWLTRGEEACKAVGAACQATATAVLIGLAVVPVTLHAAVRTAWSKDAVHKQA